MSLLQNHGFRLRPPTLPDRHRVEFHWDWLPDPDDRGRVARFTAPEAWIEVEE
jgi:hypothetical protein